MGSHDGLVPGKKQITAVLRMDTDEGISGAVEIEFLGPLRALGRAAHRTPAEER